jgi:hypothetical protein
MSDEELRALERAARAGDLDALAAWGRALARAGRDPAEAARLAARAASLVELPCWSSLGGDGQQNRACDVEPLREAPRLAWRRDGEPRSRPPVERDRLRRGRCLLGGWPGLVVVHREPPRLEGVDPVTGATRWSAPVAAREPRLIGDVLVAREEQRYRQPWSRSKREPIVREGRLVARCLRSGDVLFTRDDFEACPTPGAFVALGCLDERRPTSTVWTLAAHDWPDPRRPPTEATRWTTPPVRWHWRARRMAPCGSALLVEEGRTVSGLDLATGVLRWRHQGEGLLADAAGLLARERAVHGPNGSSTKQPREGWSLADLPAGVTRALLPSRLVALALGRSVILARPWHDQWTGQPTTEQLHLFDRAGERVTLLERPARPSFQVAIARDVVYTARAQDGVEAMTSRGERMWRLPWSALGAARRFPAGLLPFDRRLVVAFDTGALLCLG